jgi:hypothetical protein
MPLLNEAVAEDVALMWFEGLGYTVGHGADFAALRPAKPQLAPGEPAAKRNVEREKRNRGSISMNSRTSISTMTMMMTTMTIASTGIIGAAHASR